MPTIQQQLNQLKADKATLNTMLNTMGVETTGSETFTELAPLVGKIVTDPILQDKTIEITENGTQTITADEGYNGLNSVSVTTNIESSGGGKYAPRKISFYGFTATEMDYELANLDISNILNFSRMFESCWQVKNLDLSSWDTSKILNIEYIFKGCTNLESLNVSNWNTSKVVSLTSAFEGCSNLKKLDLSGWDTSRVTNFNRMFYNCLDLEELDIRNFDFSKATYYENVFGDTSTMSNLVPYNCKIIVKDNTAKNWVKARRSDFTNVKTVAEL